MTLKCDCSRNCAQYPATTNFHLCRSQVAEVQDYLAVWELVINLFFNMEENKREGFVFNNKTTVRKLIQNCWILQTVVWLARLLESMHQTLSCHHDQCSCLCVNILASVQDFSFCSISLISELKVDTAQYIYVQPQRKPERHHQHSSRRCIVHLVSIVGASSYWDQTSSPASWDWSAKQWLTWCKRVQHRDCSWVWRTDKIIIIKFVGLIVESS